MIETPTMTETATMSAAMAIEVRLKEREISRGAIRPMAPNRRALNGGKRSISAVVKPGVRKAQAMSMAKRPTNETNRPTPRSQSSRIPSPARATKTSKSQRTARRAVRSRDERCRPLCGVVRMASQAGMMAAMTAEATPTPRPLKSVAAGTLTLCTSTTK